MEDSYIGLILAALLGSFLAPFIKHTYYFIKNGVWNLMSNRVLKKLGWRIADLTRDNNASELGKMDKLDIEKIISRYIYFGRVPLRDIYSLHEIKSLNQIFIPHPPIIARDCLIKCFSELQFEKEEYIRFRSSDYKSNNEILSRSIQILRILSKEWTTESPEERLFELLDRLEQINNLDIGFWGVVKIFCKIHLFGIKPK